MIKKELINQSIDYMLQRLDEGITVKEVAAQFHYSEYYFSRAFKAITGQSVYAFIKHLKMDQSAIDIKLKKGKAISDIGLEYGYSASNYSSAFKLHHKTSPSKFRKATNKTNIANPFQPDIQASFENFEAYNNQIRIEFHEETRVIYERFVGSYGDLKQEWLQFFETYKNYMHDGTIMMERFYDDPAINSSNSCLCDLCATVDDTCQLENVTTLKGGKFASYRFEGEIKNIFGTLQGVFAVWLPKSGYEMDEHYGLNIYRRIDKEIDFVILDLCIPVK
jgi:AraC family transcriptional regulator